MRPGDIDGIDELRSTPAAMARAAHARRVAVWCREVSESLQLPRADRECLERAALLHQFSDIVTDDRARRRLLAELKVAETGPPSAALTPDTLELLRVFHRRGGQPDARISRLAAVLEMCDGFDEAFEMDALAPGLSGEDALNSATEVLSAYLQVSCGSDLVDVVERLPVFPTAAHRALSLLADEEVSLARVESVVAADQVLAGHIVQCANSAAHLGVQRVSTLRHALSWIGVDNACKVVAAASLKPMFASRHLHKLWNHSIEVAAACERLAAISRKADPEQAFLAGLVHDVGRLALLRLPLAATERYIRLMDQGCPRVLVERVLFGRTHMSIGAGALRKWNFSEEIVDSVASHHAPEQYPATLSALLYLAEESSGEAEDLPSAFRLSFASGITGVRAESLEAPAPETSSVDMLRFAA
ncbi:MAG: HDOD domain-containing protein [Bryobacteraceae bacterium]